MLVTSHGRYVLGNREFQWLDLSESQGSAGEMGSWRDEGKFQVQAVPVGTGYSRYLLSRAIGTYLGRYDHFSDRFRHSLVRFTYLRYGS